MTTDEWFDPSKIRVAHIITKLETGGAQYNTLYTLEHLDREKFNVMLICGIGGREDERALKSNYPVFMTHYLRREINPWNDFMAFMTMWVILTRMRPDIVHTHSSKAGILGRMASYACRLTPRWV